MRRHCKVIAAITVALLLGAPALAQFRGGGGILATNASVQKELKLTDEQVEKVKTAAKDLLTSLKDSFPGKDATAEQRAEFAKKSSEVRNKVLAGILKPAQMKRLRQIELQQSGPTDADSQKELGLSDEQKTKIKEIADKSREERRDLGKGFKDNPKETQEKMAKLTKDTTEKELAVLTDAQKKQWKEMTGEPFEVKIEPRTKNNN
jgi:hypothetical protein